MLEVTNDGQNSKFTHSQRSNVVSNMHLQYVVLSTYDRDNVFTKLHQLATTKLGLQIPTSNLNINLNSFHDYDQTMRRELTNNFASAQSLHDYKVNMTESYVPGICEPLKDSLAYPMQCVLSLTTNDYIVQRSPETYAAINVSALNNIVALLRFSSDAQKLGIQFNDGSYKCFMSTSRDTLLSVLLDRIQQSRGSTVPVLPDMIPRSLRCDPHDLSDMALRYV